jgi:hypothetical protein
VYFFFEQLDHFVKLSSTYFRYLGYVITYMHDLCFLKLNIGNKYGLCSTLKKCMYVCKLEFRSHEFVVNNGEGEKI